MSYNYSDIYKYFNRNETITLDDMSGALMGAGTKGVEIRIADLPDNQRDKKITLSDVKLIKEFDEKKRRWEQNLEKLLKAGAVKVEPEKWSSLTTDHGLVLVELAKSFHPGHFDTFFLFGRIQFTKVGLGSDLHSALVCHVNAETTAAFDRLKAIYDPQSKWGAWNAEYAFIKEVANVYLLNAVEGAAKKADEAPTQNPSSETPTALALIDAKQTFQVPYLITNQPDGNLPDMQDFGLERVGSAEGGWYSLCPLKADRALAKNETVSACLVHRRTGELTRIDYTAQAGKLGATQWLKDFATHVAAAGKPITVGGWSDSNEFSSSHTAPRLWCQADYRAFSTAPFNNNLVQVLACDDDYPLAKGQTLSLQVRDLKTQALHEQHLFTAEAASGWGRALCAQVNRDSHLLRAGVPGAGCTVTPNEVGNAFWGPQCAELCVTLAEVNWWASRTLDGTAVPSGGALHAWVYDAFSQRLLGHHAWTPSKAQCASGKWLKVWAEALATSEVAPYLRVNTTTAMLEQRGDALRIFATLADDDYAVEGPLLAPVFKAPEDALLVTVRHPGNRALLHHALFRPQDCDKQPGNQKTWLQALARFIETQQWPELCVKDGKQLWLPRHAELLVALDNVGDGNGWSVEDYGLELLNADEWPSDEAADPVQFTLEPLEGATGVNISSLGAELEFRLDKAARDKGYRVMACVPRQRAAKQLREAYIAYVEAAIAGGYPVEVTFTETNAFTAAKVAKDIKVYFHIHSRGATKVASDALAALEAALGAADDALLESALNTFISAATADNVYAPSYVVAAATNAKAAAEATQAVKDAGDTAYATAYDATKAYAAAATIRSTLTAAAAAAAGHAAITAYAIAYAPAYETAYDTASANSANTANEAFDTATTAATAAAAAAAEAAFATAYVTAAKVTDTTGADAKYYADAVCAYAKAYVKAYVKAFVEGYNYSEVSEAAFLLAEAAPAAKLAAAKLAIAIIAANKEATPVWPVSVTGDTITWQGPMTHQEYDLYLDFPESERGKKALTVGHLGALQATQFWHDPKPVSFTPPQVLKVWKDEISFLCEDYGNTSRSELFDTTGHGESGVDPRTGLFHAHYPVASLQGLQGQGPACDLTLHYSALRANEAGLGDGWAWRFSSVQVRDKLLTLADGAQVKFTDGQWTDLGAGKAIKLASCVVRSNKDYSEFTLDLPSGRQEVLKKPSDKTGDEEEPNKAFHDQVVKTLKAIRDKSKPDFPTTPENWQQWVTMCMPHLYYAAAAIDYAEAVKAWDSEKGILELNKRIAELQVPFMLLLPSTIESPYGEQLTFEWKRQKGQFLLLAVNSGAEALFKAEYITPQAKTAQVNMQVWPQSKTEKYEVQLKLKDYLLRTLKRLQNGSVLQQVDCDYDDDPALDRVLCGLRELDGSVECVKYQPAAQKKARPGLPRVALHTLVPGDGQQNQVATYRYDGDFLQTDQRVVSVEYECGAHGDREQHVLVHGRVKHSGRVERFELLRGMASGQDHWLAFSTREDEKKRDRLRVTKGYRYTGAGDEFAELFHALEAGANSDDIVVKDGAVLVERQRELLTWFFKKSDNVDRPKLAACITRLLASAPRAERDALGRTVEVATQEEDMKGNVQRLHKSDEHTLYRCYYTKPGDNPITLNGVKGLEAVPTLSCPFIPEHASAPVMAEYQCDPFGNPQGLRLFGYRQVTRGSRELLEQAEVVLIEGVKGQLKGDRLDADATWALADSPAKLLWRQRSTEVTAVSAKATPSKESKVKQWSVKDTQVTHLGTQQFKLENIQQFEDNPNEDGIVVRVTSTTEAGSSQVSKELRSRHGRRRLEQVEQGEQVHWQYDALGRVTQQTRYQLKVGSTGKDKDQQPDEQTATTYSADGKVATHTHANQDLSRSYLDGLQRTWRREWRKHGTQHYAPLEQYSLQGLDGSQRLASCEWDYLPGGQAVVEMTPAVLGVGPQAWVKEQGGLDGPGTRSMLQAQRNEEVAFEPYATKALSSQRLVEQGLDAQCLFQRTTDYTYRTDGTFEQLERLTDAAGQAHLQLSKHFDSSGQVIAYERTVGKETHAYGLERDALGRVTKLTRPDNSTVEHRYHGLSNHATELRVDGKVVAKQKVTHASTLTSRTVGSRAYSFTDDSVTLPDKTTLTTLRSAEGMSFKAKEHALTSLTQQDDTLTLASAASDPAMKTGWEQTYRDMSLPGRQWVAQTSPRAKRQGCRWQSLRGRPLASLRADGHWQRVFSDEQGRVLRTCQDHEEVVHRYDALGRLQSRQAQALKAGGQWQVLSEHDGFGQEVTRRFLHNGRECFKQCLTWRGDGRLASKTSYQNGTQLRAEHFTYDALDRLQRYECKASAAEHCPQDAQGLAVKAQVFSWDALNNLTRCVTTGFDGTTQNEDLVYGTSSDPTRLTGITRNKVNQPLTWNSNGYLTDDANQQRFSYNAAGQLDKVSDSKGTLLARYEYDGSQRLAAQYLKGDESTRELRYDGDQLIGEIRYDKAGKVSQTTSLSSGLAQYDDNQVRWLIDDPQVGVAGQVKDGALELAPLLPFGEGKALHGLVNGYNGMRRDPLTGHYHAGNGYRSYDPALRRYAQPDWLSPFGEGGLNDYAHCPDPVNLHDPSGAIMLSRWDQSQQLATYEKALQDTEKMPVGGRWRGLAFSAMVAVVGGVLTAVTGGMSMIMLAFVTAMSVLSFAFELASVFTADSNPELSRTLGIVSVATGVLSTLGFFGLLKLGIKGLQLLSKGARLIGKGAKVVWNGAKTLWRNGFKGLSGFSRTGRAARSFTGRTHKVAWGAPDAPRTVGGLRGALEKARVHLSGMVEIGKPSTINFARSGVFGKIGDYLQSRGLFSPIMQTRVWRSASYAADYTGTALDANILQGTILSSISLEEQRREALEGAQEQPAQGGSAATSVRNAGSYSTTQVPKLPSLSVERHRLPPATYGVRFW